MKPRHIRIVRRGDATALVSGSHHCGTTQYCQRVPGLGKGSILPIRWVITATCGPDALDHRGFAFDQAALEELIHDASHRHVHDSCERLAMDVAGDFIKAVVDENAKLTTELYSLIVDISPAPYQSNLSVMFSAIDESEV